jgi:predicted RNA-binding Zn-ribbon protein involved in translation (DUF1610 family)
MSELVRVCRACQLAVEVRWTFKGAPVFWTCPECGIREGHETEKIPNSEVGPDDAELSEEAMKL